MARKGKRHGAGWKWIVARHGSAKAAGADRVERGIEKGERRYAREVIAEQLQDYDPEHNDQTPVT